MSASMSPTLWPARASATARFADTVDFPTPPLPDEMASTLPRCGSSTVVDGEVLDHAGREDVAAAAGVLEARERALDARFKVGNGHGRKVVLQPPLWTAEAPRLHLGDVPVPQLLLIGGQHRPNVVVLTAEQFAHLLTRRRIRRHARREHRHLTAIARADRVDFRLLLGRQREVLEQHLRAPCGEALAPLTPTPSPSGRGILSERAGRRQRQDRRGHDCGTQPHTSSCWDPNLPYHQTLRAARFAC